MLIRYDLSDEIDIAHLQHVSIADAGLIGCQRVDGEIVGGHVSIEVVFATPLDPDQMLVLDGLVAELDPDAERVGP